MPQCYEIEVDFLEGRQHCFFDQLFFLPECSAAVACFQLAMNFAISIHFSKEQNPRQRPVDFHKDSGITADSLSQRDDAIRKKQTCFLEFPSRAPPESMNALFKKVLSLHRF